MPCAPKKPRPSLGWLIGGSLMLGAHAWGATPPAEVTADLRVIGKIDATARQLPGPGSWTTLTAADEEHARRCGAKLLADLLGFGDAEQVSAAPTVLKLAGAGCWRLGLDGPRVQVLFAADEAALAETAAQVHADAWAPVRSGAYPRWFDRFDNDAVSMGFFGWGILPKDIYRDFDWVQQHFRRALTDLPKETNYLAPGVFDFSALDWWQALSRKHGLANDVYLSEMHSSPGRPAFAWNLTPLPYARPARNSVSDTSFYYLQLRAASTTFSPLPQVDPYLRACQYGFAARVADAPDYGAHFATAELCHDFAPFLTTVAGSPATQAAWREYLRTQLGWDLAQVGKMHRGDEQAYQSWDQVTVPTMRDFAGWNPQTGLDLADGWAGRPDVERRGEEAKWFASAGGDGWRPLPAHDPLLIMYAGKHNQKDAPFFWFRRSYAATADELARWRFLHVARGDYAVDAYLNGQPLKKLTDQNPVSGDEDLCFELGSAAQAGENVLVLNTHGQPLHDYVFLSPNGRWRYPAADPGLNRRYFDAVEFSAWWRAQWVEGTLRAYRAGDPQGHPQLIMAPRDFQDLLIPLCRKYGAFPHCTGQSGACWAPWVTSYAAPHGLPLSSEPGGPPRTVRGLQKMVTLYALLGNDSVNFLFDPSSYRDDDEGRTGQWVEANRELLKCLGKLERPATDLGVLRSVRNAGRLRFASPWNCDITRGTLQSVGRRGQLIDPSDVVSGRASEWFKVLFDAGTELMTEAEVAGLERYVREGGIFVALHNTGLHSPETAYAWPISRLTGLKVVNQNRGIGGRIKFTETQNFWPKLRGQELNGWGLVYDWLGNDTTGEALGLEAAAPDVEVVAEWVGRQPGEGRIAIAARKLGRGLVLTLGSTFWRQAKDEGGRYTESAGTLPYLDELFAGLGIKRVSSVDSEPASRQVFAEAWRSKNGLYDLYLVARVNDQGDEPLDFSVTFNVPPPSALREISAAGHPETKFEPTPEGGFTIPGLSLTPMQLRVFAAPRADLASAPRLWLQSLERRWNALEPVPAEATPARQKPSPWFMPLAEDWALVAGDERWPDQLPADVDWAAGPRVRLGAFDTLGLEPEAVAHFRQEVVLPETWRGRRVSLVFQSPKDYFWGVTPNGRLWVNGQPSALGLQWRIDYSQAIDLPIPADGKLELVLEVDGRLKPGEKRCRPSGVIGLFYLLANPQPLADQELNLWTAASEYGESTPVKADMKTEFRYLETRFTVPTDWPREKLFLEAEDRLGWLMLNDQLVVPPAGMRQLLVSGLLKPAGEENVLRWAPREPSYRNIFKETPPRLRLAAWPDLPFTPGQP